jgi:hypothetical protein
LRCDYISPISKQGIWCKRHPTALQCGKKNGISMLYDDIAADNSSYKLFLKNGFEIDYQDDTVVMVKKAL